MLFNICQMTEWVNEWMNKQEKEGKWHAPSFGNTSDLPICVQFPGGCKELTQLKQLSTLTCTKWGMSSRVQAPTLPQASTLVYKPCPVSGMLPLPSSFSRLYHMVDASSFYLLPLFSSLLCIQPWKQNQIMFSICLFVCLHLHDNVSSWRERPKLLCL